MLPQRRRNAAQCDYANFAPAEEAFRSPSPPETARSSELRAPRAGEAVPIDHAPSRGALRTCRLSALEGFLPTLKRLRQALLAVLAETDEVRARRRQSDAIKQVAYGNALDRATRALAAVKARFMTGRKDAPDRLAADYGLWGAALSEASCRR